MKNNMPDLYKLPSVDRLLRSEPFIALIEAFGRKATVDAIRSVLKHIRKELSLSKTTTLDFEENKILSLVSDYLISADKPTLKPVLNLTGTVLHTNLGRSPIAFEAIEAMKVVASGTTNLEFNLERGERSDRDVHIEDLICSLTGAEAATVVNNNAAAVMLVLNTLSRRKEVPVSRGELVEIGGSFRIPDIMSRSDCRLVEVGTTNRTHLSDFEKAIGPKTGLIMAVHTSNYVIEGFTSNASEFELADLAHKHELPFVVDLGSGTLVDLEDYGLPHERTPQESIKDGADLVTFSGDKLLGGPQAGLIVGRSDLIKKLKKNPLKRALRCDKMTIACLAATLRLYDNPDRLIRRLPALRMLTRSPDEIKETADRIATELRNSLENSFNINVSPTQSQIGSGALPIENLDSYALVISPIVERGRGAALKDLSKRLRSLPVPIIGRILNDSYWLDLRCLEDEEELVSQMSLLNLK
ncbi:MAG: L-seryl-tRNA(Sec) selenium transferase [Alphaproteobacteria bacterium]|jgi:L-seryl-tRNA(Ser) seleniumtransferase|nr:L-seryl-tRNA(Sec) selenium transferase [Alphaproteobacteria bacterium]|tara:strand:+ start:13444 stop:14856 length:1413 start_codon:yes stop_codon:yes gene_type:complete